MRGEGEALVHWRDSRAAAELVDTRDDGMTLLMRRIRPALTLDEAVGDYHEQLAITGTLVRRLHEAGRPPAALPGIDAYVDPYRRVLGRELDELLESSPPAVAAHADLHGGNVLLDRDRWVAIDPKGVRGDPHLDVWLLLCPQAPALPDERHAAREEMWRRIRVYSDAAGLDPGRAGDWARAIARAEAVLSPDSAYPGWPTRLERVADAL
jgi:streptomycin 6-kinase